MTRAFAYNSPMHPKDEYRYCRVTLRTDCNHCGHPVPLNEPHTTVLCNSCLKEVTIPEHLWVQLMDQANESSPERKPGKPSRSVSVIDGFQVSFELENRPPSCEKCDKPFPVDGLGLDEETNFCCVHCGDPARTMVPPAWLKKAIPGLVKLYAVDPSAPPAQAGQMAVDVKDAPKPVVLNCPSCNAALKATVESERTIECQYCNVNVYLPDAVWRSLHPAKTAVPFYVVFRGQTRAQRELDAESKKAIEEKKKAAKDAEEQLAKNRAELGTRLALAWVSVGLLGLLFAGAWVYLFEWAADNPERAATETPDSFSFIVGLAVLGLWVAGAQAMRAADVGYNNSVSTGFLPTLPLYLLPFMGGLFALFHFVTMLITASADDSITGNHWPLLPMFFVYLLLLAHQAAFIFHMMQYGT